ncbi:FkbM family methyltransferase [Mucilaginibacter sp. AK015]|uniref:FkbM family methyltransferase n=1 Tax=Mucilaginibacter sp. AK015 TaxID=2723072 RepID=UPI001607F82E|nr:FkbM family methyltransferase [Mucilaginibacter sp. AK015]MBB5395119.1 FkbM family methyltransferase [Mucilaginibacter sp. AK015]
MKYQGSRFVDKLFLLYVRKTPNHPFKIRIVNWINNFFFGKQVIFESANGSKHYLSTGEYTGHQLAFVGEYEPLTFKKCESLLHKGGILFDVGASMGLFSLYLSKIPNLEIYALEPSAQNFLSLLKNVQLNHAENIHTIHVGLSNEDSFGYIVNLTPKNTGTTKVVDLPLAGHHSYLIQLTTMISLIKHFNIKKIDLLKIDVEGYEINVFKGLFGHPSAIMPENIIMEFSDLVIRSGLSEKECINYIKSFGYEIFTVTGVPFH